MSEDSDLPQPLQETMQPLNGQVDSGLPGPDGSSMNQYLFFLSGQFISLMGSGIVQFTIIWWITITTQSGFYLALASLVGFGPTLIVGLFAGVYVDRWNRKKILGFVDGMEALASMVLVGLFFFNVVEIWHILVILGLRSLSQGFHEPAIQAIIPLMIPRKSLSKVNSFVYMSTALIFMIGPVVAALLLATVGLENMHLIILIDMATFLIALIPLIFITIPPVVQKLQDTGEKRPFREDFSEGIVFIKQKKGLLSLLSMFTVTNFFSMPLLILVPLVVTKPSLLNSNVITLGIGFFVLQLGVFFAALTMIKYNPFRKNTTGVFVGIFIGNVGIFIVTLGALWGNINLFYTGMILFGITTPVANVSSQNIWQVVVPPELMGRVFAVRRTIAQ
ncbi:MAG: MFS transporter, partial [Candidatus Heimdallarchaeota archaeon]|nr:MFS transporter [Candidatus Heimdallarchaeota archaeon]